MPDATAIKPQRAARAAKDGDAVDHLARLGLLALGIVHLLVGWLALQLVFGGGSDQADSQGALRELSDTPVGGPLLWLIVVGFAGLVLWQLTEAAVGHTDEEDGKRAMKRVLSVGKAVVYGSLGWSAAKIAAGGGSSSGDSSGETFTSRLMSAPAGQVLVALVGLAIVGGAEPFATWIGRWRELLAVQGDALTDVADAMDRVNPIYIPRNHLVEDALSAATGGDLDPFRAMLTGWQRLPKLS